MKVIKKFQEFGLVVLIAFLISCVSWFLINDKPTEIKSVNGVEQVFPKKLTKDFEIVEAHLDEYMITIYIRDKRTDEIYESTLPSEDLEELVCNIKYYDAKGSHQTYNCESEEKIVDSMIMELGKQTIELIEN